MKLPNKPNLPNFLLSLKLASTCFFYHKILYLILCLFQGMHIYTLSLNFYCQLRKQEIYIAYFCFTVQLNCKKVFGKNFFKIISMQHNFQTV